MLSGGQEAAQPWAVKNASFRVSQPPTISASSSGTPRVPASVMLMPPGLLTSTSAVSMYSCTWVVKPTASTRYRRRSSRA